MSQADVDAAQKALNDALALLPTSLQMLGTTGAPGQPFQPGAFVNVQELALSDPSHVFSSNNLEQNQAPLAGYVQGINLVRQLATTLKVVQDALNISQADQTAIPIQSDADVLKNISALFGKLAESKA